MVGTAWVVNGAHDPFLPQEPMPSLSETLGIRCLIISSHSIGRYLFTGLISALESWQMKFWALHLSLLPNMAIMAICILMNQIRNCTMDPSSPSPILFGHISFPCY